MIAVDLTPEPRRTQAMLRRRAQRWTLTSGTLAGAMIAGTLGLVAVMRGPEGVSAADVDALSAQVEDASVELNVTVKRVTELTRELRVAAQVSDRPDWSALLGAVADALPPGARVVRFRLDPLADGGYTVSLRGRAPNQAGVSGFVTALRETGLFTALRLGEVTGGGERDRATRFELECELGVSP
ncbi:MAG: PilN domain-containing protein [Planctomycetota bacterium]